MTASEACQHAYPHGAHRYQNPRWNGGGLAGALDEPYQLRCPGVRGGRRHFKPAVRREILHQLRESSRYLQFCVREWAVDGRVFDFSSSSERSAMRPRMLEEYPENSVKAWSELASDLDTLISRLSSVRELANDAVEVIEKRAGQ